MSLEHGNKSNKIKSPVTKGVARVPVVMQMEALECGAACLDMILAFYGLWLPLEQVREDCGVSRDGSNARNILRAARSYGLNADGYRLEPEDLKNKGEFPCIVHWNFNHFIVCDGFRNGRAYLNDPAKGSYSVPMEDFDKAFTGICIMLSPGEEFVTGGKKKSIAAFARKRLEGAGSAVFFVALTMLIASLTQIVWQGFSRVFLDVLLTGKNPAWVTPFLIFLSLIAVIEVISAWMNAVYALRINGKLAASGNASYMWKVLHLPMKFFSQRMAGDILQRQETNAGIAGVVVNTVAPLAFNFLMLIFYLIVMLRYSPMLTAAGVAAMIINMLVSRYISSKRVNFTRVLMRDSGNLASATVSGIEMIETIKASGAENGFFTKWSGYQAGVNTQTVRYAKMNEYLGMIPLFVSSLSGIIVQILGVYLVIRGEFTVGMVMAFQGFLASFNAPVQTLIQATQAIQELRTQMERVEDVMEYPSDDTEDREITVYDKLGGSLQMKDVTFGYSPLAPALIEDFSLSLERGQSVAFVGASGCGKSTLAKLLSGLYKPWSGEILFDGTPISEIPHSIFTGSLAVVDQDIILFEDTIANNIKMWDDSIEDFEMILAARDAKLHEDIMMRDGGYDYKIMEGGKDFSGGQRQRMEIARVLAQDPTIIILDEATSALDAKTEYEVVKAIKDRGITCIVIAHRLSTIRDCDEIIVMDRGKAVERGTHDYLMENGTLYRNLVMSE